jgi:hypothetical protein
VAFWANQLTRWLKKTQAIPGANILSTQTQSGRVFNAKPGVGVGATSPTGYRVYQSNGNIMNITLESALVGYVPEDPEDPFPENWSLEFSVSSSKLNNFSSTGDPPVMTNPVGTSAMDDGDETPGTELYDGDASNLDSESDPDPIPQTYYRIPIIRSGKKLSQGGVYRENIFCADERGPIVELVRIG